MGVSKLNSGRWRARYRDGAGKQHARHFDTKREGEEWLARESSATQAGVWIAPDQRKVTVKEWADRWIVAYGDNRPSTVRQAKVHLKRIVAEFGPLKLSEVGPSHVKAWMASLRDEGLADSTRYALHRRLSQLYIDAQHEGLVTRQPTSRRTAPRMGKQRPYVATDAQVWALYDAMPDTMRAAILLGAFVGLRAGELVAARVSDVDTFRGEFVPRFQYSEGDYFAPLKTDASRQAVPVPAQLVPQLLDASQRYESDYLVLNFFGQPITPQRLDVHFRRAVRSVPSLPDGFRLHDLRHYYVSALIHSGLDLKEVQARARHASATVTMNTYGHLMETTGDRTRDAVAARLRPVNASADAARPAASSGGRITPMRRRQEAS